jgi:hypothetical protein
MVIGIILTIGLQLMHQNKKYSWKVLTTRRIYMIEPDEYEVEEIYNDPKADTIIIYDTDSGQHVETK